MTLSERDRGAADALRALLAVLAARAALIPKGSATTRSFHEGRRTQAASDIEFTKKVLAVIEDEKGTVDDLQRRARRNRTP